MPIILIIPRYRKIHYVVQYTILLLYENGYLPYFQYPFQSRPMTYDSKDKYIKCFFFFVLLPTYFFYVADPKCAFVFLFE